MARPRLSDPRYYFNRHESWLAFNRRVLEEALDEGNPLLERVKFLAITASNLDEFVEVRMAGLLQQVEHGNQLTGPDGLSPGEQLQRLARELHSFLDSQYDCWNQKLLPALRREGIRILSVAHLDRTGRDAMDLFFTRQVDPILTPVTIDPAQRKPFSHEEGKSSEHRSCGATGQSKSCPNGRESRRQNRRCWHCQLRARLHWSALPRWHFLRRQRSRVRRCRRPW